MGPTCQVHLVLFDYKTVGRKAVSQNMFCIRICVKARFKGQLSLSLCYKSQNAFWPQTTKKVVVYIFKGKGTTAVYITYVFGMRAKGFL